MSAEPAPDVDEAALRRLDGLGGAAFVAQLIGIFLEESPARLAALRQALAARDAPGAAAAAHALISSAGNLGAGPLAALARRVEREAEAERWDVLPGLVDELAAAHARVYAYLRAERVRWQQG